MKKNVKRILLGVGGIIILFLIIVAGPILFTNIVMLATMTLVENGHVPNTNIYAINDGSVNVYLVETDNGYIMFDAGLRPEKLKEALTAININVNDIKWIFISHSDYDHVAGLTLFPNAEVYIGEDELQYINGTARRSIIGGNRMPSGININEIILLSDMQELFLYGTKVKCIKAPGHTAGSMLFLVDDQYLFTGDASRIKDGDIMIHLATMDRKQSRATIEQLEDTIKNSTIVFTSHHGMHFFYSGN